MTEFSIPRVSPDAPSDAHLRGVLFRLSDREWRQVMASIPGAFTFMTQVPPGIRRHEPALAKMWVTRASASALVDWAAICTAAVGHLARQVEPSLAEVESKNGVSLELARDYLRLVTSLWGSGPAKVMLLGQECVDGVESPLARGEEDLLASIDLWAQEATNIPPRDASDSAGEDSKGGGIESTSADLDDASSEKDPAELKAEASVDVDGRLKSVHEASLAAVRSISSSVENGDKAPAADLKELAAWNEVLDQEAEQLSMELGREVLPELRDIAAAVAEMQQALHDIAEEATRDRNRLTEVEESIVSIEGILARNLGLGRSGIEDALRALVEERDGLRSKLGTAEPLPPSDPEAGSPQQLASDQAPTTLSDPGQGDQGVAGTASHPGRAPEPDAASRTGRREGARPWTRPTLRRAVPAIM